MIRADNWTDAWRAERRRNVERWKLWQDCGRALGLVLIGIGIYAAGHAFSIYMTG